MSTHENDAIHEIATIPLDINEYSKQKQRTSFGSETATIPEILNYDKQEKDKIPKTF